MKSTPSTILDVPLAGVRLSELPEILRQTATSLQGQLDKIASPHDCTDPLPRRHDLIDWPGSDLFQLEVVGDDGDLELVNLRIFGRIVSDFIKSDVWSDAQDSIEQMNEAHRDNAEASRADHAAKQRRELAAA